jgi:hypothetical protein
VSIRAIYVKAPNDTNGNPRRGFLFLEDDSPAWFEPEGYGGVHEIASHRGQYLKYAMECAPVVNVTASEYRRLKKDHA